MTISATRVTNTRLAFFGFLTLCFSGLATAEPREDIAEAVERWWKTSSHVTGVVVRYRDVVVYEGYKNGQSATDLMPIYSITKSVGAILTGIALREGDLESLDAPIAEFLRPKLRGIEATKQGTTVRHVLTMSTGLNSNWSLEGRPVEAYRGDLDQAAFALKQVYPPGVASRYSTLIANLLVPVIETSAKQELEEYANTQLFQPLGIDEWSWYSDDTGRKTIGAGLRLRTADIAKIGQLVLNKGVFQGVPILEESFVNEATSPLVQIELWNGGETGYGFMFWQSSTFPHQHFIASGYAGQMIFGVPDLDLVVAVSAPCCMATNAASERLVTNFIVPVLSQ